MRILITGASGFLGSALARYWLDARYEVGLLLRRNSNLRRLGDLANSFEIMRYTSDGEICNLVNDFFPDVVVHTACSYGRKGETLLDLFRANHFFGVALLQGLHELRKDIFFINTASALPPYVSPYALSKNQFSEWGRMTALDSSGHLRFVNAKLQHMYGPLDDESKFTTHVLHTCQRNESKLNLTHGLQVRDFIYLDDVISAYDILLHKNKEIESFCEIEIGSGASTSVRQFVETAHRLTESRTQLIFGAIPYRPNEVMHCKANIDRMVALGWRPKFNLETGIHKTIELEQ